MNYQPDFMDFSEKEMTCIKGKNSFLCSRLLHPEEHFTFPTGTSDKKKKKKKEPTSHENTSHYSFSAPSLKVVKSISVRVLASLRNFSITSLKEKKSWVTFFAEAVTECGQGGDKVGDSLRN